LKTDASTCVMLPIRLPGQGLRQDRMPLQIRGQIVHMTAFLAKSTAAMIHLSIARRLIHWCTEITNERVIQNVGITNEK
jgi:hypothetical protein